MAFALLFLVIVFGGGLFLLLKLLSSGRLQQLKQQFPPNRVFEETRLPCHAAHVRSHRISIFSLSSPATPETGIELGAEAAAVFPEDDRSDVRFQMTRD